MNLMFVFALIVLLNSFESSHKREHSDLTSTEDAQFIHIRKQESTNEQIMETPFGCAHNRQNSRNSLKEDEIICEDSTETRMILKESEKDSKEKRSEPNDMNCHLKNEKSQLKIICDSKRVFHNPRSTVRTMVNFGNSSCEMKYLVFIKEKRRSMILVNSLSIVLVHCCSVHDHGMSGGHLLKLNEGHLVLSNISYCVNQFAEICEPLVCCDGKGFEQKNKNLKMFDSDFSSFALGRSISLLASTDIREIAVCTCHFANISQSARGQSNRCSMGNSENEYRFEGCFVEKVDSPLGGGLVEGMRSEHNHFLALNSSYSQCIRRENADPVVGNKTMKRKIIDSGDATFVDCDFNNLSSVGASNTNGGAIFSLLPDS